MVSPRYALLEGSIRTLRRYLLPDQFEDTGFYEDEHRIATLTLAFRVLCHAEIEAYFEDRVDEIATGAWSSWENNRRMSHAALCLLAFCEREVKGPPESLLAPQPTQNRAWNERLFIRERLKSAVNKFARHVKKENNGIREKNIMALLLPIGFHPSALDSLFLADIDDFGKKRGEAAHSSTSPNKVRKGVNPKLEYDIVLNLLDGIKQIDRHLTELLADAEGYESLGLNGVE